MTGKRKVAESTVKGSQTKGPQTKQDNSKDHAESSRQGERRPNNANNTNENQKTRSLSGRRTRAAQSIPIHQQCESNGDKDTTRSISGRRPAKRQKKSKPERFRALKTISKQASQLKQVNQCSHCGAIRFYKEAPGFCCSEGKISLRPTEMHPILWDLYTNETSDVAKEFRRKSRSYNNSFAFTTLGMKTDKKLSKNHKGNYTLKVNGTVHHYIEDLEPRDGYPVSLQLYFYDTAHEVDNRLSTFENLNADIITLLMDVMKVNPYENFFRGLKEVPNLKEHKIILRANPEVNRDVGEGAYGLPVVDQIAAIWEEPKKINQQHYRDIQVHTNSGRRYSVNYYYGCYDPLQYPLLFPYGEPGWQVGIKKLNPGGSIGPNGRRIFCPRQPQTPPNNHTSPESMLSEELQILDCEKKTQDNVSIRQYYCYIFQIRNTDRTNILKTGRLVQQFIIDVYIKMETQRLDYLREQQKGTTSRMESLQEIKELMATEDNLDSSKIGRRIILNASFQGSPRDLKRRYMNALALVQKYGKPDFFITMTCNTNWKEIQDQLVPGEDPMNRPDLLTRVFHAKNAELREQLVEKGVLGNVAAYFYVIEFQKRGLPHAHWLLVMENKYKITSADAYDIFVSAEIPDPEAHPHLHSCVMRHMMHGPCGELNKKNVCMLERGTCKNKYPKQFADATSHKPNSYPNYRRRDNGRTIYTRNHKLDNRWVVPYNPYLLSLFDCHMNVEIVSDIKLVKYLYKYVCKGNDKVRYSISQESEDGTVDEIKNFQNARWVCAPEAMWRIYEFNLNEIHPPVNQLHIHEPEKQQVHIPSWKNIKAVMGNPKIYMTQLTEFFEMNRKYEEVREMQLLYREFPEEFVWKNNTKTWTRRKTKRKMVGRLVTVSPSEGERYYIRVLLNHVRAPTSFDDLRTVNGSLCKSFREAAMLRGLLQSDNDLQQTLQEAVLFDMPYVLRRLFATILFYNSPTNPKALWEEFRYHLSEDFIRVCHGDENQAYRRALDSIDIFLQYNGRSVDDYKIVDYNVRAQREDIHHMEYRSEKSIEVTNADLNSIHQLNSEQQNAFDQITSSMINGTGGDFFIDGPGGTGKTFLYKALLAFVRSKNEIALAVATSGVAASLLPGGRTAHNRFKLPFEIEEKICSGIRKQSNAATIIVEAKLILWDEATMANRKLVEAHDELLRDLCENDEVFGGKTVVFGGDFRQTIPVVRGAGKNGCIDACLVRSELWKKMRKMSLTYNMRAREGPQFTEYLMRIGNGTEKTDANGDINLPTHMCLRYWDSEDPLEKLINEIFPSFQAYETDPYSVIDRAILTPRNDCMDDINNALIEKFPGQMREYFSTDLTDDPTQQAQYQDFLNATTVPGLSPHMLKLKPNCPIMLIRNLNAAEGMCNGTRMVVKDLGDRVIGAVIASGEHRGKYVMIPRIPLEPNDNRRCPIPFKRHQFPIKLCFAMTINKAQGQTLDKVGIYLPEPVFSHGQLYVALSRARTSSSIRVLIKPPTVDHDEHTNTKNVVYEEILEQYE